MTLRRLLLLLAVGCLGFAAAVILSRRRQPPAPDAGVPLTLAQERAARISDLRYHVTLHVPAQKDQPIPGQIVATFSLTEPRKDLAFDFAQPASHVQTVTANGKQVDTRVENGHVIVSGRALAEGPNTIQIAFTAGDESLNRNDDYLYALFVPARASLAMPVFDQPDLKARWKLTLEIPDAWTAVSNGRDSSRQILAGTQLFEFDETQPISTYLFTFAAGKFQEERGERDGRTFRMLHRETDAAKVARNRDAIFDLHGRALAWLEDYTGITYPFGKFDFVLIPSFQFGGMEHPGAIFYNASGLLLDESATQNQHLGRASVISHETAHMWFGDLVTMRWFNDVWMKEVFANFMAAKIVNPSFPEVNHELRFFFQHYPGAYEVDRTAGANPIRQDLANLNEAGSLYGAIIYQKAPIVMRQLELLVGADGMRDGLRAYLKNHAYGNATWTDLVTLLDARTPVDLVAWSRAWVEEPGRPTVRTIVPAVDARAPLAFESIDPRGRGLVWPQVLDVLTRTGGDTARYRVSLGEGPAAIPEVRTAPAFVLPTGGGLGYGYFNVDAATLEFLTTSLHTLEDPVTRGAALVTFWEAMLEGRASSARAVETLLTALPVESNELILSQMLGYFREAFWRYTPAAARATLAARAEPLLRDGLARAGSMSARAAWFNTLRSVATTPATLAWLENVWRREVKVDGLPLSESDEAELALDLAVRDVANAEEILRTEQARLQNPDRKARFAFVTPAVSRDPAERARFFESLADVGNRRREAWVLEGARYLHHPLRAETSRQFVKPALDLVWEIQRTGDIFFPKRWADATLSGYQSAETADEVRAYIEALPANYPPRLKWVLLASADPLFRASR